MLFTHKGLVMLYLDILKVIMNPPVKQEVKAAIMTAVRETHGDQGVSYLEQLWDISRVSPEVYSDSSAYRNYYTPANYQALLPLCRLAYLYEQNGIPEEHAFKLAVILETKKEAMVYLHDFISSNQKSRYPIHDACLFSLPEPGDCDFATWKMLARVSNNKKPLLANRRFRDLLIHAPALERLIQANHNPTADPKTLDLKKAEAIKKEKEYFSLKNKPQGNLDEARKLQRQASLSELSQELSTLRKQLYELCGGIPLSKMDVTMLLAYYDVYRSQSNAAHAILVNHGIDEKNITLFYSLKRQNNDEFIPNAVVDGNEIGYAGIYIKKLDILGDEGAAIAACLGKITPCCQYLGGIGQTCAVHGITSPHGGFYILYRGNVTNPSLNDVILASSWVWRSQNGALCFDSIETSRSANTEEVRDMFRYLGYQLCTDSAYRIPYVNAGAQSGVTDTVAQNRYPANKIKPVDYRGYTDAHSQLLLADRDIPYLFYGYAISPKLESIIEKATQDFFHSSFNQLDHIKHSSAAKRVIAFALATENNKLLSLLKITAASHQCETQLEELIAINQDWLHELENSQHNSSTVRQWLNRGAYIDAMNKKGNTYLHLASEAADIETVQLLIKRGALLDVQNQRGNTALIIALKQLCYGTDPAKRAIGITLVQELVEHGAGLDIIDHDEVSPLIIAVKNQDINMVTYFVEKGADIELADDDLKTAICWAVDKGWNEGFYYLLSKGANINIISYEDKDTLLMMAANQGNLDMFQYLLKSQTSTQYLSYRNAQDETVLHKAARHPDLLKIVLNLIDSKAQLAFIKERNNNGKNVLSFAAPTFDSLQIVLSFFGDEEAKLAAIKEKNEDGCTVLHSVAGDFTALNNILSFLPNFQAKSSAVKEKDKDNKSVLFYAAGAPTSLRMLLSYFPNDEEKLTAIKEKDIYGESILYSAATMTTICSSVLPSFSTDDIKFALVKGFYGGGELDDATPQLINTLFSSFSKDETRLATANITAKNGFTILQNAVAWDPDLFKAILSAFKTNEAKLAMVREKFNSRRSILSLVAGRPSILSILLSELSNEEAQLAIFKVKDNNGKSILYYASDNPTSLPLLLSQLKGDEAKLATLVEKHRDNNTVLHHFMTQYNPDIFQAILSLFTESGKLSFLKLAVDHGVMVKDVRSLNTPDSFTLKYLTIYSTLTENQHLYSNDPRMLSCGNAETRLFRDKFDQAASFDQAKELTLLYINQNAQFPLAKILIQKLLLADNEQQNALEALPNQAEERRDVQSIRREIARLRSNTTQWFFFGNNDKADSIENALQRAIQNNVDDVRRDPDVRDALGRHPLISFFRTAKALNNIDEELRAEESIKPGE